MEMSRSGLNLRYFCYLFMFNCPIDFKLSVMISDTVRSNVESVETLT